MSGSGRFCPRCGAPIAPGEGLPAPDARGSAEARICRTCYLEALELVDLPEEISLYVCTGCGAVKDKEDWRDAETADLTELAIEQVADRLRVHRDATDVAWRVEPVQRGPNEFDLAVNVTAHVDDYPVDDERTVTVRIVRETCPTCGRKAGDYYAGTVQVRGTDRIPTDREQARATDIAKEVVAGTGDRDTFVSEVIDQPEGVDIRVSTNKVAEQISNRLIEELGGSVDTSETLVTEDEEGEGVYRVAHAVRLPRFRPGDILRTDTSGAVLLVGDVRGHDLETGEVVSVDPEGDRNAEKVGGIEDAREAMLIAIEDEHAIQVLHPSTSAAVTIRRPPDLTEDEEAVPVFEMEGELFPIPHPVLDEVDR